MSFLDAAGPLLYTSRALGLAPFKIVENRHLELSKPAFIFSVVMLLGYAVVEALYLYTDLKQQFILPEVPYLFVRITSTTAIIVASINILARYTTALKCISHIISVEREVKLIHGKHKYSTIYVILQVLIVFVINCSLICIQEVMDCSQYCEDHGLYLFLIDETKMCCIKIQFINLILVILKHNQHLNDSILFELQRDYSLVKDHLDSIRALRKLKAMLFQMTKMINSFYSPVLLFLLAASFCSIICCLFVIISCFLNQSYHPQCKELLTTTTYSIWCCSNIFYVVVICTICSKTSAEDSWTAVLVHRAINRTNSEDVREELQGFSLQLLSTKVIFTAGGFFTLDLPLLFSVIAAVTTYLVILIQFQITMNSPTNAVCYNVTEK